MFNGSGHSRRRPRKGHAVVEAALIAPWIFFLFVGVLDFGFYSYSLISVQNAARAAALDLAASNSYYTQALSDPAPVVYQACLDARNELRRMPNWAQMLSDCSAGPLTVQVQPFLDSEGEPALRVIITYQTIPMIPIPGLLTGTLTTTRSAEVRMFGNT